MEKKLALAAVTLLMISMSAAEMDMGDSMNMGGMGGMGGMMMEGMVMNENKNELPPGCDEVSGHENITVKAGKKFAKQFNGKMFTYNKRSFQFESCTKLTVTFNNTDNVRHQWMVHDLPRSIYDMGMFHMGVTNGTVTGTFILPSGDHTLLIHCGLPQHMQKGMKAQLKVGEGNGNLPNIPGYTGSRESYEYERKDATSLFIGLGLASFLLTGAATYIISRRGELTEDEE